MSDYWAINISSLAQQDKTNNYIFLDKTSYFSPGLNLIYNKITPLDYGFPESYGSSTNPSISSFYTNKTHELILTKRLRCGFIQNKCINLCTKRYEPGDAYLELSFDKDIYCVEVYLSWWSSDERVYSNDSSYTFDIKLQSERFLEVYSLWDDFNVPYDRSNPNKLTVYLPDGYNTFRLKGHANNPLNDRNKGRLSIFDMYVSYYLD